MAKFSIVTVTKNAAPTLAACIDSVARQTYRDKEYIVVDAASTDATLAIIDRHRHVVTRCISEPDNGIYNAMNKGVALATGDFIYFIGADDYFVDPAVLDDVAAFLADNPGCDYLYGGISVRHPDGRVTDFLPPPPPEALEFLVCGCLPHQASFASRRAFALAGDFDERYRIAGDYDWFLRVVSHPELVTRRIDRTIASFRVDGRSHDLARSQDEVYAIQNGFAPYQTPEWLERRLQLFQREALRYRIECDALQRRLREEELAHARERPAIPANPLPSRIRPRSGELAYIVDRALSTPPRELPTRISRYLNRRFRAP
jgi:glycosyltransferase involved in cell wall biosynthesis